MVSVCVYKYTPRVNAGEPQKPRLHTARILESGSEIAVIKKYYAPRLG